VLIVYTDPLWSQMDYRLSSVCFIHFIIAYQSKVFNFNPLLLYFVLKGCTMT
jgi:hypothetical protein